jgi:2,4-dienoyl-CoA reductase-like NADH-dependent reductase (Old Yellow Enzyme family)
VKYTLPGQHKSFEAFRAHLQSIDPDLDAVREPADRSGPMGQQLEIGGRTVGNRYAVHPMEGWDGTPEGLPTEFTLRRWRRFGRSTAKLIWGGEAFAVRADGRANPLQLFHNEDVDTASGLSRLLEELRIGHREMGESTDDLYTGLQLTHSGRYARREEHAAPLIAVHHPVLDARSQVDPAGPILTDLELESIGEAFVRAARRAWTVGFDFVDIKCCHGYLLHELLGARSRPGPYGGSFENRTRLLRRVLKEVRAACPGLELGVRVSAADVVPHEPDPESRIGRACDFQAHLPYTYGFGIDPQDPTRFDLREPIAFLALLREHGVNLVNISLGSPYTCPHLQRPAAYPPSDGYAPPVDPLESVAAHLQVVRALKAAEPELILVGSGYTYLMEWLPHVAEHEVGAGHVDFVGLGRMVLSYPELPADVLAGRPLSRKRICRTLSDCTTGPRAGLVSGCFPLDPYYRDRADGALLREFKRGRRST